MELNLPLLVENPQLPPWLIVIFIVAALVVIAAITVLVIFLKKKKTVKVNDSIWIDNLGGKDNIVSLTQVGSRINLVLKDKEIINKDNLKQLGVTSILVMSNKVTLVVENNASDIAEAINASLNN